MPYFKRAGDAIMSARTVFGPTYQLLDVEGGSAGAAEIDGWVWATDVDSAVTSGKLKPMGARARIRAEASRRKVEGGVVPAGETKWIGTDPATVAQMALAAHLTNAEIATMSVDTMDGGRWNINRNKVTAYLQAYATKMAAIDLARAAAIDAYQADPQAFDFAAIAWPADYVPA